MTFAYSIVNLLVIILAIVVWIVLQYVGHGIGMASSQSIEEGSSLDIYLSRMQKMARFTGVGAIISLVTQ